MSYLSIAGWLSKLMAMSSLIALALFINEMPISNVLQSIFPDWPFLVMLMLSVSERWKATVIFAFSVGLLQDLFLGTPLGSNAFIFTVCCYIVSQYRKRFCYAGLMFQTLIVSGLTFLKVVFILIVKSFMFALPQYFWSFLSIPLSMFAWVLMSWVIFIFKKERA